MDITVNVHTEPVTEIARNLPSECTKGGSITLTNVAYPSVTIFPPHDPAAAVAFWQYLSNVASDMADYAARGVNR